MLKYAKIIKEETKEVSIALGSNPPEDYTEMDVEQGYDGNWYVEGYAPEKPAPTYEEIDQLREDYRKEHIDSKTAMRSRKMANGTWTDELEQEYLELDAKVTEYIEKRYPYPKT